MNLSEVAVGPAETRKPAAGKTYPVTSPAARGYQTVLPLTFDTSEAPDGLEIDDAGCRFDAVFQPFDYNALNAPPIPPAVLSLSKDGKAAIVKLDGPRAVLGVTLNPPRAAELHRADGLVQADKAADSSGFIDLNFGVQAADSTAIAVNQVTAVSVRGDPTNPRLAIAGPEPDLKSPAMFWPTPDAVGKLAVHASNALADGLRKYLSDQWAQAVKASQQKPPVPLPDHIDAAVVIQSDAPCRIRVLDFSVRYHKLLASFPDGTSKQVLHFAGKQIEAQSLSIQLPAAASVTSGTLRVNESLHSGGALVAGDDLLAPLPIAQNSGIRIGADGVRSGGQRVTPSAAVSAAGIALGVMALSPGAQLAIELQPDQNGLPSGKKLAEASLTLEQAGQPNWALATFKTPATLPAAPFWILIRAAKGSAIWLAEAGADPVQLLEQNGGVWTAAANFEGLQAMNRILAVAQEAGAGQRLIQAQLSIGAATPTGTLQQDGSRLFDLTAQVNAFLATVRARSPRAKTVAISLVFTAGAAGLITVYPPHIAYDV
jgi:hypothetical protein